MAWYVIEMPETSLTDGVYHRLCRAFQRAFINAGAPPELALFAERNSASAARRLFLSPRSQSYIPELISHFNAQSCVVPEPASVTLVYGVPGAQMLLTQHDARPTEVRRKRKENPAIYPITRGRAVASGG